MTTFDVLDTCRRRWYVLLAGIAMTLVAVFVLAQQPGVYWTRYSVLFLAPPNERNPNALESTSSSLIATTGLVERLISDAKEKPATASSVTLIGQGITNGSSIELPNAGGQWAQNFNKAQLDVQVAGPSPESVAQRADELSQKIESTLHEIQEKDGVRAKNRITTEMSPTVPTVAYANGSRARAIVASAALGIALSGFLTVFADRLLSSRTRARRQPTRRAVSSHRLPSQRLPGSARSKEATTP